MKRLKKKQTIDETKTETTNKIVGKITDLTDEPEEYKDSTEGKSNKIKEIFQPNLDEFEDSIAENEDNESLNSGLIKNFN